VTAGARWRAWNTDVHLLVRDDRDLPAATALLKGRMVAVDVAASRFRDDSELRGLRPGRQRVTPLLASLLRTALDAAERTDGIVDPTLGRNLRLGGYDTTFDDLPAEGPAAVLLPPRRAWQDVVLDGEWLTLPDGVELDLGATAKAWLADDVAARLTRRGVVGLVNVGGDLALAGAVPEEGWAVGVGDPGVPGQVVAVRTALATSSTGRRTWYRDGVRLHHVFDPRTGRPARPCWRTVTVAAETCVEANTASTAAVVLGPLAPEWLAAQRLPARLAPYAGPVVTAAGWPDERRAA
jgi:thiamine biosynthesis lipoprotein